MQYYQAHRQYLSIRIINFSFRDFEDHEAVQNDDAARAYEQS